LKLRQGIRKPELKGILQTEIWNCFCW